MTIKLSELKEIELMRLSGEIIEELITRKVVKTHNKPISGYARWLVRDKMNYKQVANTNESYDFENQGKKYLVRSRQIPGNKNLPFSVIRELESKNFDVFIAIIFDEKFNVEYACEISFDDIIKIATYNEHQNGHIIRSKDLINSLIKPIEITSLLI